jgi:hypothetical protein
MQVVRHFKWGEYPVKFSNAKKVDQQPPAHIDPEGELPQGKVSRHDRRVADKVARHNLKAATEEYKAECAAGNSAWTRGVAADRAAARSSRIKLDAISLSYLPGLIFLGGHMPGPGLTAGAAYDLRFLENRLSVFLNRPWEWRTAGALVEISYSDVEAFDIGGPGLVKSGGGFFGGGFGAVGAVEGMVVATLLNALTVHTEIKTIVRVQGPDLELFLLHTKTEPEALRIELSRPLAAIRLARSARPGIAESRDPAMRAPLIEELGKLAAMLDNNLLTREEFDQLKAKLIAESE